nr:MAG TPA: hypothetical protein [Bacteriophage sp.]
MAISCNRILSSLVLTIFIGIYLRKLFTMLVFLYFSSALESINWIRRSFRFFSILFSLHAFSAKSSSLLVVMHFHSFWTLTIKFLYIIEFSSKLSSLNLLLLHFLHKLSICLL